MLLFRETGGRDGGISDLNSNLWIINLGSWSNKHQEPPPEDTWAWEREGIRKQSVFKSIFFDNWLFSGGPKLLWIDEVMVDLGLQKGVSVYPECTAWNSVLNFNCQPLLFETVGLTVFV